ncbi:Zinc transporter [Dispira simplex]|nr:Zinc transporter [Dispira simplex]
MDSHIAQIFTESTSPPVTDFWAPWLLSLAACLSCVVGDTAAIVVVDPILHWIGFKRTNVLNSQRFISGVLAFGAGVMLATSVLTMLPSAKHHLRSTQGILGQYPTIAVIGLALAGVLFTVILGKLAATFSPQAVSCGDGGHHGHLGHRIHDPDSGNEHSHTVLVTPSIHKAVPILTTEGSPSWHQEQSRAISASDAVTSGTSEGQRLLSPRSLTTSPSCTALTPCDNCSEEPLQKPLGLSTLSRRFFVIALQTGVAVAIHKFPEGLVTFVGRVASPTLGWSVFLALAIHNFPEGMTLAIPFYVLTGSRFKAFAISAGITGLVQPLGVVLGYLLVRFGSPHLPPGRDQKHPSEVGLDFIFGAVLSIVGGMMVYIALGGALPLASTFAHSSPLDLVHQMAPPSETLAVEYGTAAE